MGPLWLILLTALPGHAADTVSDPDWAMFRHDTWLSGRSPLKGALSAPKVTWQHDLRAWDNLLIARFSPGAVGAATLRSEAFEAGYLARNRRQWGIGPPEYDLAGDGKLVALADEMHTRYARIIPGSKGIQKIHNDDYFGTGTPEQRKLYAYAYEPGSATPKLLWESGPWGELEGTTLLVVDVDNDGRPEIVGNTWGRLLVWDAQTGKQKMFLQWHPPKRDYGYFAAVKLTPDDPYAQFVVVADFVTHVDVIGNDGKELKHLWTKDIEPILGGKYKACRPLVNSALDVDGDGCTEVVANLYNDTGDGRWHFTVFDGLTGKVRLDAPDLYVYAAEDVDRDRVPELFCSEAKGLLLPEPARLSVANAPGGRLMVKLAVPESGRWEFTEVRQLPLTVDTMAAYGRRTVRLADVDGDGRPEFFVGTATGLSMYGSNSKGAFVRKGLLTGKGASIIGAAPAASGRGEELLVRCSTSAGEAGQARCEGAELQAVACSARAGPVSPPVVAQLSRAQGACVAVQDALERIVCLELRRGQAPRRRWALPGRGISADAGTYYGVVAADLDGDGAKEVVFGRPGADGHAEMVSVRGDGTVMWTHPFPEFAAKAPVWNFNGLTHWAVGRLTGRKGLDVAVSLRRSTMHTDETHLLDGLTGREVWANPYSKGVAEGEKRGFGGALTAALDVDGDGCEDILCAYPDEYYAASGKTGQLIFGKWASEIFPGGWLAYAVPVVGRFLDQNALGAMWTQGGYRRGVMTVEGAKVWAFDYKDGYGSMPCVGDVNGDGRLEGLSVQHGQTTCYDMATGQVRWTSAEYPQASDGVAADLNGDGKEEFVFGSGGRLVALNEEAGKPNAAWTLALPAGPGAPAIADLDGDGQADVAVMTGDGLLNLVTQAE